MPNGDHQPRLFPTPRVESVHEHVRAVWVFQRESAEMRIAHGDHGAIGTRRIWPKKARTVMTDKTYVWQRMAAIAQEYKLPEMYPDDVWVHDRNYILGQWSGQPFVWILRTCGSHIWRYPQHGARFSESAEQLTKQVIRTFGDPEIYLFFYDGQVMNPISAEDFYEMCQNDRENRLTGKRVGLKVLELIKGGV